MFREKDAAMEYAATSESAPLPAVKAERLQFEILLADLSARFINLPADRIDQELIKAERQICEFLGADRSSLWQTSPQYPESLVLTHLHGSSGGQHVPDPLKADEYFPWCTTQLLHGETIVVEKLSDLPPEAARDLESWKHFGTHSCLSIPLATGSGPVVGALTFASTTGRKTWRQEIVTRCELIAQIFANALGRKRSDNALRDSEERYRTIAKNLPGVVYQFYAREDGRWGMHYVDERAIDICGMVPQPLDTFFERFTACVAPECHDQWIESIRDAVRTLHIWEHEFRFLRPDGKEMYLRGLSQPRKSHDEVVFSGLLFDITRQRRAEEELRHTLDEVKRLQEQLQGENLYLRKEVEILQGQIPIVGSSKVLRRVIAQAQQVATTDSTVLVLGETGTGKELFAAYLHRISRRSGKPFVTTNIAAIPSTLLESELFGREKGAYTSAMTRQIGRFEMADGGTLLLDEIGEMPLEMQAKLLRILQTGEFERLGSSRTMKVDVRVIAATNRKLPSLIRAGTFREDLYYRLNVFPIELPPLRDRPDDIPLLVWSFVQEFSKRMDKSIERLRKKDLDALQNYNWPGNIRELRNVVERSMILTQGPELRLIIPASDGAEVFKGPRLLRELEKKHVLEVLQSTSGKVYGPRGAAQALGLKPSTLYSLMERLGIQRSQ
jgi:formate hydrogenlyase transcriptional activator